MKSFLVSSCMVSFLIIVLLPVHVAGDNQTKGIEREITISGEVRRPLSLTMTDLALMRQVSVRLNEVSSSGDYRGAFMYTGVSLQHILNLVRIRKNSESPFSKRIDLAIKVRNKRGNTILLSWGEVFYQNPDTVIIASSSRPIRPIKTCSSCHSGTGYRTWEKPLQREVSLPRLVLADDFYSDRCLEGITSIEVIEIGKGLGFKRKKNLHSEFIQISIPGSRQRIIKDISAYPRKVIRAKQIGDGRGYHGLTKYSGASLLEILNSMKIKPGFGDLLLVTAPDGYRSVVSYGEMALTPRGGGIILADKADSRKIDTGGRFCLIFGQDLSADRWIKSVSSITVISPLQDARFFIIGIGCGDNDLITLDAINYMARADAFICTEDIKRRFSHYMAGKPVLFDPLMSMAHYYQKKNPTLTIEESRRAVTGLRKRNIEKIKLALKKGKTIAFLDYGDPTIYGSWTYWLVKHVPKERILVRPGISAFNAGNAMIGKNLASRGSLIITVPDGIRENESMLRAVAEHGDTLAIFVGLKDFQSLFPLLRKYYSGNTPVFIAFRAGYSRTEKLVRTDIAGSVKAIQKNKERFLGIIYIGPCLSDSINSSRTSRKNIR